MDELSYREAVRAGIVAVPWDSPVAIDPVLEVWLAHVRKFAQIVPHRVAAEVASFLDDEVPHESVPEGDTLEAVLRRVDDKIEAQRASIVRYAEPTWGAGQQGYGSALGEQGVLMDWDVESGDPCDDCVELADGGPYALDDLPTWPGMGDTVCLDRCKCQIRPEAQSWADAYGGPDAS